MYIYIAANLQFLLLPYFYICYHLYFSVLTSVYSSFGPGLIHSFTFTLIVINKAKQVAAQWGCWMIGQKLHRFHNQLISIIITINVTLLFLL